MVDGINPLVNALSIAGLNISLPVIEMSQLFNNVDDYLKQNANLLKDADVDINSVASECVEYDNLR